jgi:hypothetical protein
MPAGNKAVQLSKPRWVVAHDHVPFARSLLRSLGLDTTQKRAEPPWKKSPVLDDLRVTDISAAAIRHGTSVYQDRKGNWGQRHDSALDAALFVTARFYRYRDVERFLREQFAGTGAVQRQVTQRPTPRPRAASLGRPPLTAASYRVRHMPSSSRIADSGGVRANDVRCPRSVRCQHQLGGCTGGFIRTRTPVLTSMERVPQSPCLRRPTSIVCAPSGGPRRFPRGGEAHRAPYGPAASLRRRGVLKLLEGDAGLSEVRVHLQRSPE